MEKQMGLLYCFPYAGGGASAYRGWIKKLGAARMSVRPVKLPGREERFMEVPFTTMEEAVSEIKSSISKEVDEKTDIFFFGHSMGAKIAYEVAKALEEEGIIIRCLMVSGSPSPDIQEKNRIYDLEDGDFIAGLKQLGGMPEAILENQELMELLLPMLKADFKLIDTYCDKDRKPLKCSVLAFGANEDAEALYDEVMGWERYTCGAFESCFMGGGHFFIKEKEDEVLEIVQRKIKEC
ncbi:MAG: thioesterase [Lachnospiraceae bacterium]|nr:thioesterase [Lachnospiraceae bacterium]